MKNKPADRRQRYAKATDAMDEACALGTVVALESSWPVQPNEPNFKQLRMYVQVLVDKLEKELPDFPAIFFPT